MPKSSSTNAALDALSVGASSLLSKRMAINRERLYKAFYEKNALQSYIARRFLFSFFQRFGLHITGDHFYEIIPDTRLVAQKYSDAARPLLGIDWQFNVCEERAIHLITTYGAEYAKNATRFGFREKNYYFRGLDALILYGVIRHLKPVRVLEIGQGFSTRLVLAALEQNANETATRPSFVSVDPYQRLDTTNIPANVYLELIQREVQGVDIKYLVDCEMLFVDSSHVYKF